jgi:hypothetical protein
VKIEFGDKQEIHTCISPNNAKVLIVHIYTPGAYVNLYLTKGEAEVLAAAIGGMAAEIKEYLGRMGP